VISVVIQEENSIN